MAEFTAGQAIPSSCDGSSFLTPSDGGGLFVLRSVSSMDSDPDETDILWHAYDGSSIGPGPASCDWKEASGFGNWQCFNNNFRGMPRWGQTVWGVITVYPPGASGGVHEGWILLDSSPGSDIDATRPQSPQRLRVPWAEEGSLDVGGQVFHGVRIIFEYPTERSPLPEVDGTCHLGGDTNVPGFDGRVIAGFNVYRLDTAEVSAAASTPVHYLCGPDEDCSTAIDNGWIGFIPLDPSVAGCGVDDAPCVSQAPSAWPYAVEDLPGTPNVDIIYLDRTTRPGMEYSWAVQPVLRVNDTGHLADWNGMKALDLDGDGQPEFVDPGRNGLGLTVNGLVPGALPLILISREMVAGGIATPLPVGGRVPGLDVRSPLRGKQPF